MRGKGLGAGSVARNQSVAVRLRGLTALSLQEVSRGDTDPSRVTAQARRPKIEDARDVKSRFHLCEAKTATMTNKIPDFSFLRQNNCLSSNNAFVSWSIHLSIRSLIVSPSSALIRHRLVSWTNSHLPSRSISDYLCTPVLPVLLRVVQDRC